MGYWKFIESFPKSKWWGRGRPSSFDASLLLATKHKVTYKLCIHSPISTKLHRLARDSALTVFICTYSHSTIASPAGGWKLYFVSTPRIWSSSSYRFHGNAFKLCQDVCTCSAMIGPELQAAKADKIRYTPPSCPSAQKSLGRHVAKSTGSRPFWVEDANWCRAAYFHTWHMIELLQI